VPVKGLPVAYSVAGGIIMWSGLKGATIADTVRSVISGAAPAATVAPASSATTASPASATVSESAWITSFLSAIGAPASAANVASMTDWIAHEGPYGTQGQNNPLNTTEPGYGSTSVFVGNVRNYPTEQDGINATVATVENGDYPDILALLRAGSGLKSGASAGLSKWSDGAYTSV
jgi:hypothetical protein